MSQRDEYIDLTDDELAEALAETVEAIASIRVAVGESKATASAIGDHPDPDWFRRASAALVFKGRDQQLIQLEMSRRKRERSLRYEQAFIAAARDLLDPEVYQTLIDSANRRINDQ